MLAVLVLLYPLFQSCQYRWYGQSHDAARLCRIYVCVLRHGLFYVWATLAKQQAQPLTTQCLHLRQFITLQHACVQPFGIDIGACEQIEKTLGGVFIADMVNHPCQHSRNGFFNRFKCMGFVQAQIVLRVLRQNWADVLPQHFLNMHCHILALLN